MQIDIFVISLLVGMLISPSFSSINVQSTLSSYIPYASGVTYEFNVSGMTNTIPANSILMFSLYPANNETSLSLTNCKGSISQNSAPITTSCSLTYEVSDSSFSISFDSLIADSGITFFRVQFDFDNAFGDSFRPFQVIFLDQSSAIIEAKIFVVQYQKGSLDASIASDHDIIRQDYSTIKLTTTSPIHLNSGSDITKTQLRITFPNGISFAGNTSCTVAVGTCTVGLSDTIEIASVGFTFNNLLITLTNIYLPLSSGSVRVSFFYNYFEIAYKQISIPSYCTSPCKTCGATITTCLSCLEDPNQFVYLSNAQCLTSCPDGTYPDSSNVCLPCVSPCANCIDETKCSSCIANYGLSGQSCIRTRPNYYFSCFGSTLACMLEIQ